MTHLAPAASRIRRALRQEGRLQRSYVACREEQERLGFSDGFWPESLQELHCQFEDELYFLVLATRQAVAACDVARAEGVEVPPVRSSQAIVDWRDVLEHWDDPPLRGKSIRALKRWGEFSPQSMPGSVLDAQVDPPKVLAVSGVGLAALVDDLRSALIVIENAMEMRFDDAWLDESTAAAYIGLEAIPDPSPYPGIIMVKWPGRGKRFLRTGLDQWRSFARETSGPAI